MKHRLLICTLALWASLTACGQGGDRFHASDDSAPQGTPVSESAPSSPDQDAKSAENPGAERKIIRTGSLTFRCSDLQGAHNRLHRLADSLGGYVSRDQVLADEGHKRYVMEVRVPAPRFQTLVAFAARGMDETLSRNLQSDDVTLTYVDLESRIKTKKEMELRYLQLLKAANTVPDMMQVEGELGRIRAEVESMEAQFKHLSDQVAFSTLTIEFFSDAPQGAGFGKKAGEAFASGWGAALRLGLGLISMWPLWVLVLIGWAALRWSRRLIKNPAGA